MIYYSSDCSSDDIYSIYALGRFWFNAEKYNEMMDKVREAEARKKALEEASRYGADQNQSSTHHSSGGSSRTQEPADTNTGGGNGGGNGDGAPNTADVVGNPGVIG